MQTLAGAAASVGTSQQAQSAQVQAHFRESAGYWHDLYHRTDPTGEVFRRRQEVALGMVDALRLAPGSRVLEVGCGAGFVTVELARRGLHVTAIDPTTEMLQVAGGVVASNGLAGSVELVWGDVHELQFEASTFRLVVALGVIPWLHSPSRGLAEINRVLVPGGHVVVTSDNRARLNHLVDPAFSPVLAKPRQALNAAWRSLRKVPDDLRFHPHLIWTWQFRQMVRDARLEVVEDRTVGFGPFSLLAHPLLQGRGGVALHRRLQTLADAGFPLVGRMGSHQVMLARKVR